MLFWGKSVILLVAACSLCLGLFIPYFSFMKMHRFSLAAGLTLFLMASAVAPVFADTFTPFNAENATSFSDVSTSNSHYAAIMYLHAHGIIQGYPDGTFKPEQTISRVEALKLILLPQFKHWPQDMVTFDHTINVSFSDTDKNAWYWTYIQQGYDHGLVQGYPDGTFKPGLSVNKAENLKILLNRYFQDDLSKLDNAQTSNMFPDEEQGAWYIKYINEAAALHDIEADDDGNIHPGAYLTRGEFAEMVYRLMKIDDDGVPVFNPNIQDVTLYTNSTYGFALKTAPVCKDQFLVKDETSTTAVGQAYNGVLVLSVYVPLSKQWTAGESWYGFTVMSQDNYNKIPVDDLLGRPPVILKLANNMLLTEDSPQDAPDDIHNCDISASMLSGGSTSTSASTLQIGGLSFVLPQGWSVESNINGQAMIAVPDPKYHVTIPFDVSAASAEDKAVVSSSQLLKTTASGAKIYDAVCAPGIACYYMVYNGNTYDLNFDEPQSNEPVPTNLDGVWFPSTTVTSDDTLNFAGTVK